MLTKERRRLVNRAAARITGHGAGSRAYHAMQVDIERMMGSGLLPDEHLGAVTAEDISEYIRSRDEPWHTA